MQKKDLHWTSLQMILLNSQKGKDRFLFFFLLPRLSQDEYPKIYTAFEPLAWRPPFTLLASPSFHSVSNLCVFRNTDLSKTIIPETYWSSWQIYCTSLQVFATAKIILGAKYLQSTEIKLKKEEMKRFLTLYPHRNLLEQLQPWPRNEAGVTDPRTFKVMRAITDHFCLQNRHRITCINMSPLLSQNLPSYFCFEKPLCKHQGEFNSICTQQVELFSL